jgi:hypothetical protein
MADMIHQLSPLAPARVPQTSFVNRLSPGFMLLIERQGPGGSLLTKPR